VLPSLNIRVLSAELGFPLIMLCCIFLSDFIMIGFVEIDAKLSGPVKTCAYGDHRVF